MILKWYIVKLFLWKLRGERIGLCNETNGNTFGHSYTLHKREEHLKGQNEKFLRETGVSGMSLSELHVIECIGKNGLMNVTAITIEMGMTKGAISKVCTKLFQKKFVEKMQMLDNQKKFSFA